MRCQVRKAGCCCARATQACYSNHASGTAIDLNATRHPLGTIAAHSFTKKQIAAIHARLKRYSA